MEAFPSSLEWGASVRFRTERSTVIHLYNNVFAAVNPNCSQHLTQAALTNPLSVDVSLDWQN